MKGICVDIIYTIHNTDLISYMFIFNENSEHLKYEMRFSFQLLIFYRYTSVSQQIIRYLYIIVVAEGSRL